MNIKQVLKIEFLTSLFVLALFTIINGKLNAQEEQFNPAFPQQNIDSLQHAIENQRAEIIEQMKDAKIQYLISRSENGGFGYYIFIDGQLLVDQKTIPAIQGNHAFHTNEDAEKVAQFVIEKIKQGYLPPTLTKDDIKELKIVLPDCGD